MAKGSGGTRAKGPKAVDKGSAIVAGIEDFSPQGVIGPKLNQSQQIEVRKIYASWLDQKDIWDLNLDKIVGMKFEVAQYAKDREISLNKLFTQQSYLVKDTVAKYINNPSGQDAKGNNVVVIRVPNTDSHIIVNGNHRIAAAKLSGKETISAKVLEVPDKWFKSLQKQLNKGK